MAWLIPVLAQRAASEGPRWTRAVGDQPRHPLFREWGGDRPLVGLSPLGMKPA